jgi:hypothetical protein
MAFTAEMISLSGNDKLTGFDYSGRGTKYLQTRYCFSLIRFAAGTV